jgi:hypothetical protein
MIIEPGGKKYEKPDAGAFLGTVIDVIDLGLVPSKNPKFPNPQHRTRVVWVLDKIGADGKPLGHAEQPPTRMLDGGGGTKKSRLYEIWEGILQRAPSVPYETEDLIGKSNLLYLVKDGEYVKVAGFMPVPPGSKVPVAPAGFVRDKNDPKNAAARQAKYQAIFKGAAQVQTSVAPAQAVSEEDIAF